MENRGRGLEFGYIYVTDFTDESFPDFHNHFMELERNPDVEVIPIIISSYGGEIYTMTAMRDLIKTSSKKIATIAIGKAMSAGAFLLASGTPGLRFAAPSASILVHEISTTIDGKNSEIKRKSTGLDTLNTEVFDRFASDIKQPKEKILAEIEKCRDGDWILDAAMAKKWGIIDNIDIPRAILFSNSNPYFTIVSLKEEREKQQAEEKAAKPKIKGRKK